MFSVIQMFQGKPFPGKHGMKMLKPWFMFGSGSAKAAFLFPQGWGGQHVGAGNVSLPAAATLNNLPGNDVVSFLFLFELQ